MPQYRVVVETKVVYTKDIVVETNTKEEAIAAAYDIQEVSVDYGVVVAQEVEVVYASPLNQKNDYEDAAGYL